jgi:prepilin-type N-terminal cleavage/methylation domain-containing protein
MRARARGFTLIELMVVVAIIGLLSSVAIPQFRRFQLRSKTAERALIMSSIDRAADDYFARESRYPTPGAGNSSSINTAINPPLPPLATKRPMPLTAGDWAKLNLRIDGNVYYSYWVQGSANGPIRDMYTYGIGDLDGDRDWTRAPTYCYLYHQRNWTGTRITTDTVIDYSMIYAALRGCF